MLNLKEFDIESCQKTQDAFALLNLIKIAENDIRAGRVYDSDQVFSELRKKIGQMNFERI